MTRGAPHVHDPPSSRRSLDPEPRRVESYDDCELLPGRRLAGRRSAALIYRWRPSSESTPRGHLTATDRRSCSSFGSTLAAVEQMGTIWQISGSLSRKPGSRVPPSHSREITKSTPYFLRRHTRRGTRP